MFYRDLSTKFKINYIKFEQCFIEIHNYFTSMKNDLKLKIISKKDTLTKYSIIRIEKLISTCYINSEKNQEFLKALKNTN